MAYGNNPSGDTSDALRLLVGDISTSTAREYLTDTDYDYFASVSPNNFAAAALAANSLAALFGGQGSRKKVGDLEITRADAAYYRDLAKQLNRMSALQSAPFAGGISRSDKAAVESDTDRVGPAFTRSQFANPAAIDPSQSSTSST